MPNELEVARESFTEQELATLDACRTVDKYGRVESNALTLAVSWRAQVARFDRERSMPTSDHSIRTEHDYVGALYMRNRVDTALEALPDALAARIRPYVEQGDNHLMSFTVERGDRLARLAGPDWSPSGWWWSREPTDGPIAEFLVHPS